MAKGVDDASLEVRQNSKESLKMLSTNLSRDELENVLLNTLNKKEYDRLKEYYEKEHKLRITEFKGNQ